MTKVCSISTLVTALFVSFTVLADVVTNYSPITISSDTVYSGQTNIYAYTTGFSNVDANWAITNYTYLRFVGVTDKNKTEDLGINFAANVPTGKGIDISIDDRSALFCTYRYSKNPPEWAATHIDLDSDGQVNANIYLRIGKKGGAKDTTGAAKFTVNTTPSYFGRNTTGAALWAEYLFIESSVKPVNGEYIDILQLDSQGIADIAQIVNNNSHYPVRILFNGGRLRNNYMATHGNSLVQLSPATNTVLVLEGIGSHGIRITKNYTSAMPLNGGMGTLRFQGKCSVLIGEAGNILPGAASGVNRNPHYIDPKKGPIEWKQTGDIYINDNGILRMAADNQLPYGEGEPGLRLQNNAILDVNGYTLNLCKLVSESTAAMVTNQTASHEGRPVTSTIVFGVGDTDGIFSAICADNVNVEKVGSGTLLVSNVTMKGTLTIKEGKVKFAGKNSFAKNVVFEDGVGVVADIVKSTDTIKSIDYPMPKHTGEPRIVYENSADGETLVYPGDVWKGLEVDVTEGTLRFSNVVKDKYWRFTAKTAYAYASSATNAATLEINKLGLWATNVVTATRKMTDSIAYGVTTNATSHTFDYPWQLPAGICMAEPKGMSWQFEQDHDGREYLGPEALFNDQAHYCWNVTNHPGSTKAFPLLEDPTTWITAAFRLKDNALPVSSFSPARTHWSTGVAAWILSSSPTGKDGTWTVRHEHFAKWADTKGMTLADADKISEYPHCDDNNPKTGASQKDSLKWYNNSVPYHFNQGGGAGETFQDIAAKVAKGATLDTGYIGDDYLSFSSLEIDMVAGSGTITKFAPAENGILHLRNLPIGMDFRKVRDLPIQIEKYVRSENLATWAVYLDGVPQKGVRIVIINGVMRLKHTYGFYLNFR